jgi:phosphate transport system substrate-binding protein
MKSKESCMKRVMTLATAGCLVIVLGIQTHCNRPGQKTIRVFGSTTIERFMKKAGQEYGRNGKTTVVVNAVGSRAGIDSLIAGVCDIAMSSMEPLPEQTLAAIKKGINLKPFLLGYDVIIPIVHPSNRVSDITFENLKNVFSGKINTWLVLGGVDTVIDIVDRAGSSGTYLFWHHSVVAAMPGDEHVSIEPSNSTEVAHVSKHINAIGYVSSVFINPEVKPLKINGINITENDSLLSQYHLKRALYLYVNADRFKDELRSFIVFLIINDRGRELLREAGFFYDSMAGKPSAK